MSQAIRIPSQEDASVNFVAPCSDGGFFESRLVQRTLEKPICYLSSHSGCSYSCRFCHLTATGQTMMTPARLEDYITQASFVFAEYKRRLANGMALGQRINFNFMARGEPLANPVILNESSELFRQLGDMAKEIGLEARFKISSIIPRDFEGDLAKILVDPRSQLYYSLYSTETKFRKRWVPKALDPSTALNLIGQWQKSSGRPIVLHWAFIEGQNDHLDSIDELLDIVESHEVKARFNLVRYNPHDQRHGQEPSQEHLDALFKKIQGRLDKNGIIGSKIIPRVGHDVSASCGMFVEKDDERLRPSCN